MQSKSDNELVAQAQKELPYGTSGYNQLVRRYTSHVFQRSFRILQARDDADDAVQEVFLAVFRSLPKYKPDKPFLHWLNVVTLNACRMILRKRQTEQKRRDAVQADESAQSEEGLPDPTLRQTITLLLDDLPPANRIPLLMRFVDGHSYAEIAQELEISESAAKMRVSRGSKRLRELWEATLAEADETLENRGQSNE